ncbi:ThuA domain-containing protein [Pontiellaceae bacterium B12219]|nr:ThuA domain-containing protein [Pontiellaceae bacterium B12219]
MAALPVFSEPVNVLIVDGFSNHDWKRTTQLLKGILEQSDGVSVSVSTFPGLGSDQLETWVPAFGNFDVVIQNCNDIKGQEQWPRRVQLGLEEYVANGGGLYVFHSANNAFPDWPEYNRMIGLGWRDADFGYAVTLEADGTAVRIPPGKGQKTSHGKRVDALVTRIGEHPVHAGFPRQWVAADIEIYRYARGPAENLTVLSFTRDEKTGLHFPVEWIVDYGKGRMYTSTLGHVWADQETPEGMQCAGHQTLIPRIVQWLAGNETDSELPADFPTAEARSLRPVPGQKN